MRTAILVVWVLGMGARGATIACLVRRGLALRYPMLMLWLSVGLMKSLYLLPAYVGMKYAAPWLSSLWVSFALYLLITLEAFVLQARRYDVFRFAIAMAALFAACSVGAAWAASNVGDSAVWFPHFKGTVPASVRFVKNYALVCFLFLQAANGLWQLPRRLKQRPNLVHYARILGVFFLVEWLSAFILAAVGGRLAPWHHIGQLLGVGGPLACYVAFAALLKPAGEALPPDGPPPQFSVQEIREQERFFMAAAAGSAAPQLGGSTGQTGTGSSASETPAE